MSGDESKEPVPEIVIIKRGRGGEEGHHGGVWKIAYADFMTAMMAFFLVMWLVNAANEKTKSQVASYFNPVKLIDTRTSRKGLQSMDTGDGESWDKRDTAGVSKTPQDEKKKRPTRTWQTPLVEPKPKRSSGSVLKDPFVVGLNGGDTSEHQGEPDRVGGDNNSAGAGEAPNAEAARVLQALVQGETILAGENMQALVAPRPGTPAEEGNEFGAGDKPNLGAGDKPNVGAGEKPSIGMGDRPNVGTGDKPNVGMGDESNVGIGDESNVGKGDKPNIGAGEKPDIGAGDKPNLGQGNKPDIGRGDKPGIGAGKEPVDKPSDKAGENSHDVKLTEARPPDDEASRKPGDTGNRDAVKQQAEAEPQMADAGQRLQRKLAQPKQLGSLNGVDVTVSAHAEGSMISLVEGERNAMFGIATSTPSPELRATVKKVAAALKDVDGDIVIRGHTDGRAYFTADSDNWRLSSERAHAAYRLLVSNGVASSRFVRIEGYADTDLKVKNDPNAAQNRRIEILLKSGTP